MRRHRPKTLMSFWSSPTKECLCGLAFWFMHSPLRYGPKCKETVGIGSLKKKKSKVYAIWQIFWWNKLISRIGKYTSSYKVIKPCITFSKYYSFLAHNNWGHTWCNSTGSQWHFRAGIYHSTNTLCVLVSKDQH